MKTIFIERKEFNFKSSGSYDNLKLCPRGMLPLNEYQENPINPNTGKKVGGEKQFGIGSDVYFFYDIINDSKPEFFLYRRQDLQDYLNSAENEYINPTQDYCNKKFLKYIFENNNEFLKTLDEDIFINFYVNIYTDSRYLGFCSRVDREKYYNFIRPLISSNTQVHTNGVYTKLVFFKYRNLINNKIYFYLKPIFMKPYSTSELASFLSDEFINYNNDSDTLDSIINTYALRYRYQLNTLSDDQIQSIINDDQCNLHGADRKKVSEKLLNAKAWLSNLISKEPETCQKEIEKYVENHGQSNKTLQQIFYGAPGTGKSHEIKEETEGQKVVRTTFHPDSDYSSFVGAYKPTMEAVDAQVVPVVVNSGISLEPKGTYKEKRITYKFVIQAFLKAYLGAWKMYSDNPHSPDSQFLVIEEINRGNCAQIFGDLFQLLDRNEKGFSEYPIEADSDLADAINIAFSNEKSDYKLEKVIDVEGVIKGYISNYGFTLSKDIQEGRVLLLPPNLFIWATMNTSDQSLFPIDSAFKRRWDWQYIKISEGKQKDSSTPLGWKILVEDEEQDRVRLYDWWRFLQLINKKIFGATDSADKQMGYFFAKATESFSGNKLGVIKKDGVFVEEASKSPISCDFITAETFVNKVLFYLWTDVLKDNEYDEITNLMKDGDKDLSFPDFFGETGREISPEALRAFLNNVMKGVKEEEVEWCEVAEWNIVSPQTNNNTNSSTNTNSGFKPKSVIFKITDNIQDPNALYQRARGSWVMAENQANGTKYIYVYSTPVRKITACYEVTSCMPDPQPDGKIRYKFEGVSVDDDPMINQPVEEIAHLRGQVVFYPDNWGGVQTVDNNDKESLNENPV